MHGNCSICLWTASKAENPTPRAKARTDGEAAMRSYPKSCIRSPVFPPLAEPLGCDGPEGRVGRGTLFLRQQHFWTVRLFEVCADSCQFLFGLGNQGLIMNRQITRTVSRAPGRPVEHQPNPRILQNGIGSPWHALQRGHGFARIAQKVNDPGAGIPVAQRFGKKRVVGVFSPKRGFPLDSA